MFGSERQQQQLHTVSQDSPGAALARQIKVRLEHKECGEQEKTRLQDCSIACTGFVQLLKCLVRFQVQHVTMSPNFHQIQRMFVTAKHRWLLLKVISRKWVLVPNLVFEEPLVGLLHVFCSEFQDMLLDLQEKEVRTSFLLISECVHAWIKSKQFQFTVNTNNNMYRISLRTPPKPFGRTNPFGRPI